MRLLVRLTVQIVMASVFTFSTCIDAAAQPPSSTKSSTTAMMQMPVAAPLFIDDGAFTSTLVLVNGGAVQTHADVTVRALDGNTVAMKRVLFQPHSQQQVNIRTLLNSSGASGITTGSITIMQSPDLNGTVITAVLSITRLSASSPNYINEEVAMPSAEGSQTLRAVADEGDGSPILAITSLSSMEQQVQIKCLADNDGRFSKSVNLSAGETLLTDACSKETLHGSDFQQFEDEEQGGLHGPVGIELKSNGMPGSFAAFALRAHGSKDDGYFSSIAFVDPKMVMSTTTVFAGVPVGPAALLPDGSYVPALSLANFSSQDLHVTIQYAQTSGDSPTAHNLESVVVPALSSKELVFNSLRGDPGLQNSFLIAADGTPGDVTAKLVARSDSRLKEVELLGKDLMDPQNGGSHPWSVQDGTQSTLLLFNTSNAPQYFNVVIGSGGILWQKSYRLQPLQTKAIGINGLIDSQVKDDKGRVLPKDIWSGQIDWYLANLNTGRGRLLQSNRDTAMARNFSCGVTIELCEADFISYATSIIAGDIGNLGEIAAMVCMNTCYGTPSGSGCDGCTYGWNSEDTSIASISGSSSDQSVNVLGVSPGITYIDGYVSGMQCYVQLNPSPPAPVTPTVTISGPNTVVISPGGASDPSIQLTATGSPFGGSYSWAASNSNITVSNQNAASVAVFGTAAGQSTLTVTYTLNGQSGTKAQTVTVQVPTDSRINSNIVNTSQSGCPTGSAGWNRQVLKTVTDQNGSDIALAGQTISEGVTAGRDDLLLGGPLGLITTTSGTTNSLGQFTDRLAFCSSVCPSTTAETDATQTISSTINTTRHVLHSNSFVYKCTGNTINGQ